MFLPKLSSGALRTRSARTERDVLPSQVGSGGVNCKVSYSCFNSSGGLLNSGNTTSSATDMGTCCMNAGSSIYASCQPPNHCQVNNCVQTG